MRIKRNNEKIDIVIPWVNGDDPEWIAEREKWYIKLQPEGNANSNIRYQDWDNLKYWFRAVEKFMPWINKIFFVTWGHVPEFLNTNHPNLHVVKHCDYIPQEYLPTFNSNTIEMNYFRIPELSENFIIFNDDLFPLRETKEFYYFKNNLVCDHAIESPIMPVDIGPLSQWACAMKINNLLFINRHFSKRIVQKDNWGKWFNLKYGELVKRNIGLHYWYNFVGFHDPHMASAMKKSTLSHLWEIEPMTLDLASKNRFRSKTDVSQYLIRYWQICTGEFVPRKTKGKSYTVTMDNYKDIANVIREQRYQMISLNENCTYEEFEIIKKEINKALEEVFPSKSTYEK